MAKIENFVKPVNSHLILFDKPKIAVAKGYIEKVYGLLISQHIDSYGTIVTNRTVLCDEELNSTWNINDNDNDSLDSLHYFKNFPNLSMDDISKTIYQTDGTRDIKDSFRDLENLGAIVPQVESPLELSISKDDGAYYCFYSPEIRIPGTKKKWIPCALEVLYNIQDFLKRPIKLTTSNCNQVNPDTLSFMQELLDNQFKHKIFVEGYYSNEETLINDGVYTYSTNSTKVAMTREEFLAKYPNSYKL